MAFFSKALDVKCEGLLQAQKTPLEAISLSSFLFGLLILGASL